MIERAAIGVGANLGDARASVLNAISALGNAPKNAIWRASSLYRTAPVEAMGPDFINAVVVLETSHTPHSLLALMQEIESAHGRTRPYRNAPRTLDLDLLLFGERVLTGAQLTVPHTRMTSRAFVLVPLIEAWPEAQIPGVGRADSLPAAREPLMRVAPPAAGLAA
jgi:2-amino-4-hydroxy-6-hydroxymethyldihydropteridine diphosphokinase